MTNMLDELIQFGWIALGLVAATFGLAVVVRRNEDDE